MTEPAGIEKKKKVSSRGVAGGAEAGDEQRCRPAGLPDRLGVDVGVVGDRRCRGQPHQQAKAEQQPQRELLGLAHGDIHGEQAEERCDPERHGPPAGQVAGEVGTSANRPTVTATNPIVRPNSVPVSVRALKGRNVPPVS